MKHIKNLVLLVFGITLASCSSSYKWLASEPSIYSSSTETKHKIGKIDLTVMCMKYADANKEKNELNERCLYKSLDAKSIIGITPSNDKDRTRIIDLMLSISDENCSVYKQRTFANKAALDFTKNWIRDVSTALSGAFAASDPFTSAALDGTNLVVGKTIDQGNNIYYAKSTFSALEKAVEAKRARLRMFIDVKKTQENYNLDLARADIQKYDEACSLKDGVEELLNIASKEVQKQKQNAINLDEIKAMNKGIEAEYKALQN